MSQAQLRHLYHAVLPNLAGMVVVDVGSRLGSVLYAVRRVNAGEGGGKRSKEEEEQGKEWEEGSMGRRRM